MRKNYTFHFTLATFIFMQCPGYSQNIAVNTTGNPAVSTNMFEVTQSSTAANMVALYAIHSGNAAGNTAYGIRSSATGASATNIGGYFTATGATNNYAGIFENGRVGVGTATPDAATVLDISSTTKGLLIPRVALTSNTDNTTISNPTTSLLVYCTGAGGLTAGYYYQSATLPSVSWRNFLTSSIPGGGAWLTGGNSSTTDGTDYLGTADNTALNFGVNNQRAGRVSNSTGSNVFLGYQSGGVFSIIGTNNTGIGHQALTSLTTGTNNTAVGYKALYNSTTTANSNNGNTAIGSQALRDLGLLAGGQNNVAVGKDAMLLNQRGQGNVALGADALKNTNCWVCAGNIAIGTGAMQGGHSGEYNIAIGYQAFQRINYSAFPSGGRNTVIGSFALEKNTTGNDNTVFGYRAGNGAACCSDIYNRNTFIGYQSADNVANGADNNIVIGYDIDLPTAAGDNQLSIGNLIYGTGIDGAGTTVSTGNIGIGTSNPNSKLQVSGAVSFPIATTAANITLDNTHYSVIITGGTPVVTLPAAAAGNTGRMYVIVNQTASAVTISSYLDFTGAGSTSINANSAVRIQSDGTNWYRIK